jgi:hypothetical protein
MLSITDKCVDGKSIRQNSAAEISGIARILVPTGSSCVVFFHTGFEPGYQMSYRKQAKSGSLLNSINTLDRKWLGNATC